MPLLFFQTLGPSEIAFLVLIALLLFGAKRLPELGKAVGQSLREFKKSISGAGEEVSSRDEEQTSSSNK